MKDYKYLLMQPLVSILIPCYNAERWIEKTLSCVLAQTWPRIEVIVVDDGSRDSSLKVARRFVSPNVQVISQQNQGAGAARNRALQEAQGDFIQFLDADDLLSPDKIEAQVRLLQESPPRMLAVCAARYFLSGQSPDEGLLEDGWPLVDTNDPLNWQIDLIARGAMVTPSCWLSPRAVADAAGPWQTFRAPDDDGEYFARIVLASAGIRRAQAGMSYYRKHLSSGSLSTMDSRLYQQGALRNIDLMAQYILSRVDTPRARQAIAKRYADRAFAAYPAHPAITASALFRARKLNGTRCRPRFATWKGQLLSQIIGWKLTRRIQCRSSARLRQASSKETIHASA